MRAVVQRVTSSKVLVGDETVGNINRGLLVFLGVTHDDTSKDVDYMVDKIVNLRIFEDSNEKMNLSVRDIEGDLLVVSQFTLYGDCRKGKRPSFTDAAKPEMANKLYEEFVEIAKQHELRVHTGRFQANMLVEIANDGPVTMLIDSRKNF